MLTADVLLPLATPGAFTYRVPHEMAAQLRAGMRVSVPCGRHKRYTGLVVRVPGSDVEPTVEVKPIEECLDSAPVVLPRQIELWQWASRYYLCTQGEVMRAALPGGMLPESETMVRLTDDCDTGALDLRGNDLRVVQAMPAGEAVKVDALQKRLGVKNLLPCVRRLMQQGVLQLSEPMGSRFTPRTVKHVRLVCEPFTDDAAQHLLDHLQRKPAQQALLLRYLDLAEAPAALTLHNPALLKEVAVRALTQGEAGATAALAQLRKAGVLQTYDYEVPRLRPYGHAMPGMGPRPLSQPQQQALDTLRRQWQSKPVCLLFGVTASGKTEIYMHLIAEVLAAGGQVLYLVPEIALTTQLTSRLARVFGAQMAVYHSKFPDAERTELWQRQAGPDALPLVLGARSALWLPFSNLQLVIVDEEHETSYKQADPAPRYNGRDAAIMLAHLHGARTLLGTATPSMETYSHVKEGKYGLASLTTRYSGVQLPRIVVADVKELRRKKLMTTPFSPVLTDAVRQALDEGQQAILFINRRGYAPVISCHACGWTPRCTRCDVSLTYHRATGMLVCHYCGSTFSVPHQCPQCQHTELRDVGYGTQKIEEEAQRIFPSARIARMDLDTTRARSAHEDIIRRFQQGETNLLIGTQMVTKGLDFDRVQVVGIVNADQQLNAPDFRAHERAFHLMMQVAGRAGRRGARGLVVLQTRQADLPVVQQVATGDSAAFYAHEMAEREAYGFPPCGRLIDIYLKHRDATVVAHAAHELAALLRPHFGAALLGPDKPEVSRVNLFYIRKLLLKVPADANPYAVRRTLLLTQEHLCAQPPYRSLTLYYDADPL